MNMPFLSLADRLIGEVSWMGSIRWGWRLLARWWISSCPGWWSRLCSWPLCWEGRGWCRPSWQPPSSLRASQWPPQAGWWFGILVSLLNYFLNCWNRPKIEPNPHIVREVAYIVFCKKKIILKIHQFTLECAYRMSYFYNFLNSNKRFLECQHNFFSFSFRMDFFHKFI